MPIPRRLDWGQARSYGCDSCLCAQSTRATYQPSWQRSGHGKWSAWIGSGSFLQYRDEEVGLGVRSPAPEACRRVTNSHSVASPTAGFACFVRVTDLHLHCRRAVTLPSCLHTTILSLRHNREGSTSASVCVRMWPAVPFIGSWSFL